MVRFYKYAAPDGAAYFATSFSNISSRLPHRGILECAGKAIAATALFCHGAMRSRFLSLIVPQKAASPLPLCHRSP